ncbi:haloacid dehalogenase-like hydrolase domain-containing protein Sgpp [Apium graveolens]|uniref:haloacid dehalogenase-like hydrolase domain-containing protein Sgpp n=1 Tax=Apium graveolens TaxID=4045 RepID=UPI003D7AF6B7
MPLSLISSHLFSNFVSSKTQLSKTPICTNNVCTSVSPGFSVSSTSFSLQSTSSQLSHAPLEAILFDIDGTLCDSDPIHYHAFVEMLQQVGFNGGVPISEEFFVEHISGKHNEELSRVLLPDWEFGKAMQFMDDKEALFRKLAGTELKRLDGLDKLLKWIEERGLKRAAVTNAPKPNAEMMITMLGLSDFFETVVLAENCERAKPYPDPYLKGLDSLNVSPKNTIVFEDSISGTKAGVAAGMAVVAVGIRNPEKLLVEAGATYVIKDYNDQKLWNSLEEMKTNAQ